MNTSWTNLVTALALCSATTVSACAVDDANTSEDPNAISEDAASTTMTADPITGEDQLLIAMPNGITVNLSVRQWQSDLNGWIVGFGLCGPTVAVDGIFGPDTTDTTKCFQFFDGLTQDGIVGPKTLGAMCADLSTLGRVDLRNASHCN